MATLDGAQRKEPVRDEHREKVADAKMKIQHQFFKLKGVVGVDVDYKIQNGKDTKELSIVVYVGKKLPVSKIEPRDLIPSEVDGIPTDVLESNPETSWPTNKLELYSKTSQISQDVQSPVLFGGLSCNDPRSTIVNGTIGLVFPYNNKPTMISCQHVFATAWNATPPEPVIEPSVYYGGVYPTNLAAGTTAGWYGPQFNVDLAIADIVTTRPYQYNFIFQLGATTGYDVTFPGDTVKKFGASTGYTEGIVTSDTLSIEHYVVPNFPSFTLYNQIKVISADSTQWPVFAAPGDSGAFILNDDNQIVGMLVGGNVSSSGRPFVYANPIHDILRILGINGPQFKNSDSGLKQ